MVFERGHYVPNETKEEFLEQVAEIQNQVNFLYKKKNNTSQVQEEAGGNQKIVAWLLNRNKESQSGDRQKFFAQLNQSIYMEYMHQNGGIQNAAQTIVSNNDQERVSPYGKQNGIANHEEIKLLDEENPGALLGETVSSKQ